MVGLEKFRKRPGAIGIVNSFPLISFLFLHLLELRLRRPRRHRGCEICAVEGEEEVGHEAGGQDKDPLRQQNRFLDSHRFRKMSEN